MELEYFGYPEAPADGGGNLGTAMLFDAVSARAGRQSSAAAEMRKIIGVPPKAGKSTLSEQNDRFIKLHGEKSRTRAIPLRAKYQLA